MLRLLIVITGLILLFPCSQSFSQINVQGSGIICLGDLAFFSYSPPPGQTIKSEQWNFGNTFTSTQSAPTHLYKKTGKYQVTIAATLKNGTVDRDTIDVEVLGVPNAQLVINSNTDTCQYTNNVCFTDQSQPAKSGQDIIKRAIVWGDGTQGISNSPGSKKIECHKYASADKFYVEMEVTDNKGCKSFSSRYVNILHGVNARIGRTISYPDCESAQICFYNGSTYSTTQKIDYVWTIGTSTSTKKHPINDPNCVTIKTTKITTAKLLATTKDGCSDLASINIPIQINSSKRKMIISDSIVCYGEGKTTFTTDALYNETTNWYMNDTGQTSANKWTFKYKEDQYIPGKYKIRCEIKRGKCSQTVYQNFEILGPVAKMKIFNNPQCGVNRRLFFVQEAEYVDTPNTVFKWFAADNFGENCTIERAKDINKYKNCNTTIGWFAKHDYTVPLKRNPVTLLVTDTKTGCSDQIEENVDLKRCGGNCKPFEGTIEICQNEMFLSDKREKEDPISFSLDSGKTWMPYPSLITTDYAGLYRVDLVYKWTLPDWAEDFGDDSIRINSYPIDFYDTLRIDDLLYVKKIISDSVSFEFSKSCNPTKATVRFQKGEFHTGEEIIIAWGDGLNDVIKIDADRKINEVEHAYENAGESGMITVHLFSEEGCETVYYHEFSFGHTAEINKKGLFCAGKEVCFQAIITDYTSKTYWEPNTGFGTIEWLLDGKNLGSSAYEICKQMDTVGFYEIGLIAKTTSGCVDTTYKTFDIQDVHAGVTNDSRKYYCRGLREFQDSSDLLLANTVDYIDTYRWDFGTGNFSAWEKDPVLSFDGSQKVITVRHAVRTNRGCTDTVQFTFIILTSKPLFHLDDSIGCAPHTVNFTNTSTGSTHFIWEFGDVDNSTYETTDTFKTTHTYKTPGRYGVRLVGIDSFYHPVTKTIYYCHTSYPRLGKPGLAVIVLPNTHPGFTGPDTLCMGAEGQFTSLSSNDYDYDIWDWGDGSSSDEDPGSNVGHSYSAKGKYTVSFDPVFQGHLPSEGCISKMEKKIVVLEIKADFDIDSDSKPPIYNFINYSVPRNATYQWDFGHTASGTDNYSTIKDPSHNYKKDSGEFVICLTAYSPAGCSDSICRVITNTYREYMQTYNVFTPGVADGINDEFEITLEGQSYHDFMIYNRWGEVVYQNNNADSGSIIRWNGRIENTGSECPGGTYFYVLKYAYGMNPDTHLSTQGIVTLIR